jgi:hypothetical protein
MRAAVSGSFRRAMAAIEEAVYALTDAGVQVVSPADPRVVDQFGDFLFVASDRVRAIKLVQDRHLAAIAASDFLWLVAPNGYIGQSAAMEIGYAAAVGTPIFSSEVPVDLTLRQYVTTLRSPARAVDEVKRRAHTIQKVSLETNVLLDPLGAIERGHRNLEEIATELSRDTRDTEASQGAAERLSEITRPLRRS